MDAVANFSSSLVATAPSPATSGTSVTVTSGQGALFPTTPFNAVLTPAGAAPSSTASEIVRVTAVSTDTFTITRAQESTTAQTVAVGWQIYATATKDTFSRMGNRVYDAVVAASGGDYATLGAALAAGARSVFIRRGTYAETTLNTAWSGSNALYVVGEDRENVILQLPNSATGFLNVSNPGSYLSNFTLKQGTTALSTSTTGGISLASQRCVLEYLNLVGPNAGVTGCTVNVGAQYCKISKCAFSGGSPSGGYLTVSADDCSVIGNTFLDSRFSSAAVINCSSTVNRLSVTDNYVSVTNSPTVISIQTNQGIISNNRFLQSLDTTSGSISFSFSGTRYVVANNYFQFVNKGIIVDGTNAQAIGNTVYCNTGSSASFVVALSAIALGIQVTNNYVVGNGSANAYTGIQARESATVSGNNVTGFTASGSYGIYAGGAGTYTTRIMGNHVDNCDQYYSVSDAAQVAFEDAVGYNVIAASTATTTVNFKRFQGFRMTLSLNTTVAITDEPDLTTKIHGIIYRFEIIQNGTGNFTVTWPASVVWPGGVAPTITATANKRDFIQLTFDRGSTKYYGLVVGQNY